MRSKWYHSYILLGLFILSLFYLPKVIVQKMQSCGVGVYASLCKWSSATFSFGSSSLEEKKNKSFLEVENLLLKRENSSLCRRLFSEERIDNQIKKIDAIMNCDKEKDLSFYHRRKVAAQKQLALDRFFLFAEVIYRNRRDWNSTLWINVGEEDNDRLKEKIVCFGSPVLKGSFLIGMVEYVGKNKSCVRLLTDPALTPSVRVARGGEGNRELGYLVQLVLERLTLREESEKILVMLRNLLKQLQEDALPERFLAKGELVGSDHCSWRGCSSIVKGIGFNYDFSDDEGESLELRSGKPFDRLNGEKSFPLIALGDLLVTTGMDGVFPKDIPVAYVRKVAPLKEGSLYFEIEAQLCAGTLNHLLDVAILPPILDSDGKSYYTKGESFS